MGAPNRARPLPQAPPDPLADALTAASAAAPRPSNPAVVPSSAAPVAFPDDAAPSNVAPLAFPAAPAPLPTAAQRSSLHIKPAPNRPAPFSAALPNALPGVASTAFAAAMPSVLPGSRPTAMPCAIPSLRVIPLLNDAQPRRFVRIPTHAVGMHPEQREYPRATLRLPLKLRSVASVPEDFSVTLVTRDISSTGCYFLCPKPLDAGTNIELEIVLVSRPMGRGNVVIVTTAKVQRSEPAAMPGWHGIAALFDDVQFDRDDRVPSRFLNP